MNKPAPLIALCSAIALPDAPGAPEWVHLVPMPGPVRTVDGRGPYHVADAAAVIAASLADPRGIPIDENHATQIAGARGEPAPARAWVKDLDARPDGIWGRVEWGATGEALMSERAYRGLSPVLVHRRDGTILQIRSAALTNTPNLIGLTALNTETPMNWANIAKALGLDETAGEEAILAAIAKLKVPAEAMQSQLSAIGTALGVEAGDANAIEAAARLMAGGRDTLVSLQAENAGLKSRIDALETDTRKAASKAYVEGELARGRLIPAPSVADMIALHTSNPEIATKLIEGMPLGTASRAANPAPGADQAEVLTSLNAEQIIVAEQLGLPHATFLAALNEDRAQKKDR
jgi:phage I-like protein